MKSNSRAISPIAIALALAVSAGLARAADTIRPGYWELVNRVLSPIQTTSTDRRCVAPKDIAKFMSCHINHHYECVCPEQSAAGGVISFRGECVSDKGEKVRIAGHGAYTETTLSMTAAANIRLLGIPMTFKASTDARRIADACPAGSEK